MKQEDKKLLFRDLCARLSYGVVCMDVHADKKFINKWIIAGIDRIFGDEFTQVFLHNCEECYGYKKSIEVCKPYLLPLSSMTEEQKQYISDRWGVNKDFDFEIDPNWGEYLIDLGDAVGFINWCYENHFDINGLIPMGIALDATGLNIY
jgi:hypothetical protein